MNQAQKPTVIVSGNLVYDTLVRPVRELYWGATTFVEAIESHPGGNGASTARALAILGLPVRLLGAVGNDEQGRFLVKRISDAGVDVGRIKTVTAPTSATVGIVSPTGERKFFHQIGASGEAFSDGPTFTLELREAAVHYHMASMFVLPKLRPRAASVLQAANSFGLTTSFDTNWDLDGTWMRDLAPCLPYVDYLFMNEPEAEQITGSRDPKQAAEVVLNHEARTAILKLGDRGCAIYTAENEFHCRAYKVEARDTTGAGDCFAAGFLCAVLQGASLVDAGGFANAVGALSVQAIGAANGLRTQAETRAWMQTASLRD